MQESWKILHFFDELKEKPTCLICMQNIVVVKEYNIRRHYNSKHASKYDKISGKLRVLQTFYEHSQLRIA